MNAKEILKSALVTKNKKDILKYKDECYLYMSDALLKALSMYDREINRLYVKINTKNFFVQIRNCLIENNSLEYALFYLLLREMSRKMRKSPRLKKHRNHKSASKNSLENGHSRAADEVNSNGEQSTVASKQESEKNDDSLVSKRPGDYDETSSEKMSIKKKNFCLLSRMIDPIILVDILLQTKHFRNLIYVDYDKFYIGEYKIDKSIGLYKFFYFVSHSSCANVIKNISILSDDELLLMFFHKNKEHGQKIFDLILSSNFQLARRIILFYWHESQQMIKRYLAKCTERKDNVMYTVELLNILSWDNVPVDLLCLYRQYSTQISLKTIINLKNYIDTFQTADKNIKEYNDLYGFLISSQSFVSSHERLAEVSLLCIDDDIAAAVRKIFCKLVKSNIETISSQLKMHYIKSRRTVMRQIVRESWEHMLFIYCSFVEKLDDLNIFIFECELLYFIIECNNGLRKKENAEPPEKKYIAGLRKASKFIRELKFRDPMKSILLNMLREYLEKCLMCKNYTVVDLISAYLERRQDFRYELLGNFRNRIFRNHQICIEYKIELVDRYYELIKTNNEKNRDVSVDFKKVVSTHVLHASDYQKLTPLEIKSVKYSADVMDYIKSFYNRDLKEYYIAKNFILFLNTFVEHITEFDWIKNTMDKIRKNFKDLEVMVESLNTKIELRKLTLNNKQPSTTEIETKETMNQVFQKGYELDYLEKEKKNNIMLEKASNDSMHYGEGVKKSSVNDVIYDNQAKSHKKKHIDNEVEPGEIINNVKRVCHSTVHTQHTHDTGENQQQKHSFDGQNTFRNNNHSVDHVQRKIYYDNTRERYDDHTDVLRDTAYSKSHGSMNTSNSSYYDRGEYSRSYQYGDYYQRNENTNAGQTSDLINLNKDKKYVYNSRHGYYYCAENQSSYQKSRDLNNVDDSRFNGRANGPYYHNDVDSSWRKNSATQYGVYRDHKYSSDYENSRRSGKIAYSDDTDGQPEKMKHYWRDRKHFDRHYDDYQSYYRRR